MELRAVADPEAFRQQLKTHFSTTHADRQSKVKYASIYRFTAMPQMRSDMDHTVLLASYTMPAFTPQPQNITALWLVLILPSHEG